MHTSPTGPVEPTGPPSPPVPQVIVNTVAPAKWSRRIGRFVLVLSILLNVALLAELATMPPMPEFVEQLHSGPFDAADKIALVRLEGLIEPYAVEGVGRQLRAALQDDAVKAIVLQIDSPGGGITASDTLYQAVREANAVKPVIAAMSDLAASGGYYVALGCRKIFAQRTTITGSIGVIAMFANVQKLLGEKLGVEMEVLKSGPMKDAGSPFKEMTDAERQYLQGLVVDAFDRFKEVVLAGRNITPAELAGIADGRVFVGPEAKKLGLVDEIDDLADAIAEALSIAGITDEPKVVRYKRYFSLAGFLLSKASSPKVEVQVGPSDLTAFRSGRVMYLWAPAALEVRQPR